MRRSLRQDTTLGELVHASLVLVNLLPDGFVHIPAILQVQSAKSRMFVYPLFVLDNTEWTMHLLGLKLQ